ncbi:unnamed protein product, partial [Closterium sp. NIES-65]
VPDNLSSASKGLVLLFVGAGWNDHGRDDRRYTIPDTTDVYIHVAAPLLVDLGMMGVMVHQQPMMPITFHVAPPGVTRSMSEELQEEITAFTMGMALYDPSTPEWPIFMPMAKSIVRAMDAVQLAARQMLPHVPVEAFVSVGVSKRAHMAWLSAALDKRVVAFIAYGYDLINLQPNLQHLLDSVGAVPILGRFYVDYNLTHFLHSPLLPPLLSYTDPYFFRERLTMPKLLISASNDEFFFMDDSYFYFNDLPPPTLFKIVANLDHMVIQKSYWVYDATGSFLTSLLHVNSSCASRPASSRPSLTWTSPTNPTPSSLTPHTTSISSDSPSPQTPHNPHSSQPSSLPDAEAAAAVAAVAAVQSPPWGCVPEMPAVDWPQLRWRFDWSTFTIHATSDRKPLADWAHEAGQQAAGLPAHREARARRVVSAMQGKGGGWVVSAGEGGRVVSAGEGGRVASAGRGGGRVVSAGRGGGRVVSAGRGGGRVVSAGPSFMVPFKSSDVYIAKFGTLCVQPIPFLLHAVSPPALQPDGLWHFSSSVKDIPKVRVWDEAWLN